MGEGENKLSFFFNNRQWRVLILQLIISLLLIRVVKNCSSHHFEQENTISINSYTENGRVHYERVLEWPFSTNIGTITLIEGSIMLFNCSVLVNSNSSIEFEYSEELGLENMTFFNPDPFYFILAPGESYEETFTVVKGAYEFRSELSYRALLLTEGSNATVHWWFEVLKYGEASVPGVLFSFGALTILTIILVIYRKKK